MVVRFPLRCRSSRRVGPLFTTGLVCAHAVGTKGTVVVENGEILLYREPGSKTSSEIEEGEFYRRPGNDRGGVPASS
jgi:hypothetical protein